MLNLIILTTALGVAGTVQAQDHADHAQTQPPAQTATPAPPIRYSVETTPIETLAADPAARALVIKHFPTLLDHPSYSMFKSMPLKAIAPYSQGAITNEALAALQADLDGLR